MKDSDIDYPDIPALGDEFLTMATISWPPKKAQVTVRINQDVLDWLKSMGKGYQTKLNHILRIAMEYQPRSGTRKP